MKTLKELEASTFEQIVAVFGEAYDDMLDDCFGDIDVGIATFSASQVLKKMDPIAYEQDLYEYAHEQVENNEE